jgi:hypothetical protein
VSVTGSGLDLEDTVLNGEGHMLFVVLRVMEGSLPWLHLSPKSCQHGSGDWRVSAAMMGHGGAWKHRMGWQLDASFGLSNFRAVANRLIDFDVLRGDSMGFYAVLHSMPGFLRRL